MSRMTNRFLREGRRLPPVLEEARTEIEALAKGYGLDFFEVVFEMCTYEEINMIASYGGFPTRYPHWRFGMEYEQLSKSYEYGLSKIYEMVINNDPSYAYLLEGNNFTDQKLVISHVFGHVDFFKNNFFFSKTNRRMVDQMANHATRVRRYIDRQGIDPVEDVRGARGVGDHRAPGRLLRAGRAFAARHRAPRACGGRVRRARAAAHAAWAGDAGVARADDR